MTLIVRSFSARLSICARVLKRRFRCCNLLHDRLLLSVRLRQSEKGADPALLARAGGSRAGSAASPPDSASIQVGHPGTGPKRPAGDHLGGARLGFESLPCKKRRDSELPAAAAKKRPLLHQRTLPFHVARKLRLAPSAIIRSTAARACLLTRPAGGPT